MEPRLGRGQEEANEARPSPVRGNPRQGPGPAENRLLPRRRRTLTRPHRGVGGFNPYEELRYRSHRWRRTGPEVTRKCQASRKRRRRNFGFKTQLAPLRISAVTDTSKPGKCPGQRGLGAVEIRAIYLGAVGHPQRSPASLEKASASPALRTGTVHQPASGRCTVPRIVPSKTRARNTSIFIVVLRNNEGLYAAGGRQSFKGTPNEVAVQESINFRRGVDRCPQIRLRRGQEAPQAGRLWKGLKSRTSRPARPRS